MSGHQEDSRGLKCTGERYALELLVDRKVAYLSSIKVGDGAVISARSVVTKNISSCCIA
jgi:hypothetical protein